MLEVFFEPAFWASVLLLIGMEVALGSDNVVFIATMVDRLPEEHRRRVMRVGMVLAAIFRLILLLGVVWILGLDRTAFSTGFWSPSWRELVLIAGGLFLIYKAVTELHALVETPVRTGEADIRVSGTPTLAILQIVVINAVFSVDSIITAIGLTPYVEAMMIAVIASVAILYIAADAAERMIARHPSIKALALGFLLMVGIVLVADGLGLDVLRPYLYAAMGFGVLVLAFSKAVRSVTGRAPIPEATTPVDAGDRREPVLEPEPVVQEPEEPSVVETGDVTVEPEPEARAPDPVLPVNPAPSSPETTEPETRSLEGDADIQTDDERPLGEAARPVPKSRRKRPIKRRQPNRLRTGRRREQT